MKKYKESLAAAREEANALRKAEEASAESSKTEE
jgi:hypothetical protein